MSDSYQATRVPYPVCVHGDVTTWQAPESVLELMVERGSLVLDTRVDALADVWVKTREMGVRFYMDDELAALLDALTEEDSDAVKRDYFLPGSLIMGIIHAAGGDIPEREQAERLAAAVVDAALTEELR